MSPVAARVSDSGISTAAIANRIDAGEAPDVVAEDYGVSPSDIDAAVIYERAA